MDGLSTLVTEKEVINVLHSCFDPEIPVDIYELGLIYGIEIVPSGAVNIQMTLTSPNCPVAESLPLHVEERIKALTGVSDVQVDIVWEPPWDPSKMSEAAKLQLGML